jgi:hypothetical protein
MCFQYTHIYECRCVEKAPLFLCADGVAGGLYTVAEALAPFHGSPY